MELKCPACGSADILVEKVEESLPVPYGPSATYTSTQYTCNTCGESGDFTGENTAIINEALKRSISVSASSMLENLSKIGITAAYFERAMRLPARTSARWKSGELSAAALALLRSVCTYPWLLEVSDANFEPTVAKRRLVEAAATIVTSALREEVADVSWGVAVIPDKEVSVAAKFTLTGPSETSTIDARSSEPLARLETLEISSSS